MSGPRRFVARAWAHVRALWPGASILALVPFAAWPIHSRFVLGERRWESLLVLVATWPLALWNRRSKRLFAAIIPYAYTGLVYELMRPYRNLGLDERTVHLCDLRALELAWFGIGDGASRITLQDWFLDHHWAAADLLFALPYGTFIFIPALYATYLYARSYPAALRFLWSFFALNMAGFITYHLYPAAPPWYFHQHGCVVDLAARPSEAAALMRVDELLGVRWFQGMYGRSGDVFGAVPSLHVAYTFLIVLEGWALHRAPGRALTVLLFLTTAGAAVYLDHHWVIDVLLGVLYAVVVWRALRAGLRRLGTA